MREQHIDNINIVLNHKKLRIGEYFWLKVMTYLKCNWCNIQEAFSLHDSNDLFHFSSLPLRLLSSFAFALTPCRDDIVAAMQVVPAFQGMKLPW